MRERGAEARAGRTRGRRSDGIRVESGREVRQGEARQGRKVVARRAANVAKAGGGITSSSRIDWVASWRRKRWQVGLEEHELGPQGRPEICHGSNVTAVRQGYCKAGVSSIPP